MHNRRGIYPAHAGINLDGWPYTLVILHLPRTRGDKPNAVPTVSAELESTPHTRG